MSYGYDGANRVESVKHLGANGATIQQYGYGFDKNCNRVSENITRNGVTRRVGTFTYDDVNRLKKVTFGPKTTEYFYDEVGNRVEERDLQAGKTRIFTHDDANRLTGVTENGVGIASYVWDAAGNVTQATESGVTWFYSYDLRQQITTVRKQATTGPPTFAGEYEYDYAKRRIGRNGVWNVYDGDDLLNEFSSAPSTQNSALNSYTYGNELIRSTRDGESFADAQGSVTLTSNGPLKFTEYGAFGEVITTDHEESHIGYTGQFFDNETGLMPLGNGERYYSPLLGRFLQEDSYVGMPEMPGSLNRYSYAYNNPFGYTDPSGNEAEPEGGNGSLSEGYARRGFRLAHEDANQTLGASNSEWDGWILTAQHFAINLAEAGYNIGNTILGGFIDRQDRLIRNFVNGRVDTTSLILGTVLNVAFSAPSAIINISTGGSAGVAKGAGVAAVGKHLAKMGGIFGGLAMWDMYTEDAFNNMMYGEAYHSFGEYLSAGGMGFLGGVLGGATGLKGAPRGTVKASQSKIGTAVERSETEAVARQPKRSMTAERAADLETRNAEGFLKARESSSLRTKVKSLTESGISREEAAALVEHGFVCFVAETKVHTDQGLKNIEDIKVGDKVKSYNEQTGKVEVKEVTATFQHKSWNVLNIFVEGEAKAIRCTPQHPFFVKQARGETSSGDEDAQPKWIEAGEMKSGDRVMLETGKWVRVLAVGALEPGEWVYNFTVNETHTYFVGVSGVLVHNISLSGKKCGGNSVTWDLDEAGGPISVKGVLRKVHKGAKRSSAEETITVTVGKSGGRPADDGGHLIGHRFVLDQGRKNLFAQDGKFNKGAFKTLENDYGRYIRKGYTVKFEHLLQGFDRVTGRPSSVKVTFEVYNKRGKLIDRHRQIFKNEPGQVYKRRAY